jgi:hypothetical protein
MRAFKTEIVFFRLNSKERWLSEVEANFATLRLCEKLLLGLIINEFPAFAGIGI